MLSVYATYPFTSIKMQKVQQQSYKQSPRPRSKQQTQASSTPISKRAVEYAGPSFNHSPAPCNLPPPPFLSKSVPAREPASFQHRLATEAESSPLSFLFSAKEKEDSLKHLQTQRPPTIGYNRTDSGRVMSAAQTTNLTTDAESDESFNGLAPGRSSVQTPIQNSSSSAPSNRHSFPKTENRPKKSPWASIEIPKAINISDRSSDILDTRPMTTESIGHSHLRKEGEFCTKSSESVKTAIKPKKSISDINRKKKSTKSTPAQPAKAVPRMILKREPEALATNPISSAQHSQQSHRESSASSFKPLKRKSSLGRDLPATSGHLPRDAEEELRIQAANLMSILHLQPVRGAITETRGSSPSSHNFAPHSGEQNSLRIETDLRRLLRLGA